MRIETITAAVRTLEKAHSELQSLARSTEGEMESLARAFEGLAGHADTIMNLAAAVVGCVDNENVSSVLPNVQILGATARQYIGKRLDASTGILEIVTKEVELLRQLSFTTRGQAAIVLETKALSILTNIEVGRLGAEGAGFQYLAHELAGFSKSVTKDILDLTIHTDVRRAAMEETRRLLAAELPRQSRDLTRIQAELGKALATVDSSLGQLSGTPAQFRKCVEEVAQQIAGVVAAVQAHDITRQQIDHVEEAFTLISSNLREEMPSGEQSGSNIARAHAGLTVQVYQLKAIKHTVAHWASQLRICMDGILRVSASELLGIGPVVLEQERELSSQLTHIETLERESKTYNERIQSALGGLSSLMQLVNEHLQRSKSVGNHLQLLTFNSIIEASRLGAQAAVILAIAESIKEISAEWGRITDQSRVTMDKVLHLVKQTDQAMEAFSEVSDAKLNEAQGESRAGLENLRTAAAFAGQQAQEMQATTARMQAKTGEIGRSVGLFDASLGRMDAVLGRIEEVKRRLELDCPDIGDRYDAEEAERLFGASYTTEIEREILRAALRGGALPTEQATFEGNAVELF